MRIILIVLAFITTACATLQAGFGRPGSGVTQEFAERWDCDYGAVMERAEALEQELSPRGFGGSERYRPEVGWTVCNLMAYVGRPTDVDHVQTSTGTRRARYYYRRGSRVGPGIVWLVEGRRGRWVVESVVW